jgi:hypothetical protein
MPSVTSEDGIFPIPTSLFVSSSFPLHVRKLYCGVLWGARQSLAGSLRRRQDQSIVLLAYTPCMPAGIPRKRDEACFIVAIIPTIPSSSLSFSPFSSLILPQHGSKELRDSYHDTLERHPHVFHVPTEHVACIRRWDLK